MRQALCLLTLAQLFVLASYAQSSTYAEQAIGLGDPASFILIGLGLLVVGVVGTRALRN